MASSRTKIAPESSPEEQESGLNPTIITEDCEEGSYGAPKTGHPQSLWEEDGLHSNNVNSHSSSSSTSSHITKLSTFLKENESPSHRENSSIWDISSSSSPSSTHALLLNATATSHPRGISKQSFKHHKKTDYKKDSFVSLILWPLKKLRDAYMSCMMGLAAAGDLSGLAQGSTFATSSKYFA